MLGTSLRVLIVGAGIAGLAAARALRVAGFRPEVVDRLPASAVANAGIYLPGNAARALREMGLDTPLRPLGSVIARQRFLDVRGRQLCEIDVAQLWAGVGECRALPRADLHQVLLSGAGGEVRHDTEVSALEIEAHTAKVAFTDGTRAEYDLVIGADGRGSTVRPLAALGGEARPVGHVVYHTVVTGGPRLTHWTGLLGRRAGFVVMPMGAGKLYCYADEALPVGTPPPADPVARLREVFNGYGDPVPAVLDAIDEVEVTVTDEVELSRWSRGPVLLVGDAAHATSPTLAQGAAMAFEDALVLADALRSAETVDQALPMYESRRRPRTRWVLDRTRDRERTCNVPPALRDPLLRGRGERIFRAHYRALLGPH